MKRILKYPGSKWNIAGDIVKLIPDHHSYIEAFFGSGAILYSKEPSAIETVNDLDGDVCNLFECIRLYPEKIARTGTGRTEVKSAGKTKCKGEKEHMHYGTDNDCRSGLLILRIGCGKYRLKTGRPWK